MKQEIRFVRAHYDESILEMLFSTSRNCYVLRNLPELFDLVQANKERC